MGEYTECPKCGGSLSRDSDGDWCSCCGWSEMKERLKLLKNYKEDPPSKTMPCAWCSKSIPREALRCPYCQKWRKDIDIARTKAYAWLILSGLILAIFFKPIILIFSYFSYSPPPNVHIYISPPKPKLVFIVFSTGGMIAALVTFLIGLFYTSKVSKKIGTWWWY